MLKNLVIRFNNDQEIHSQNNITWPLWIQQKKKKVWQDFPKLFLLNSKTTYLYSGSERKSKSANKENYCLWILRIFRFYFALENDFFTALVVSQNVPLLLLLVFSTWHEWIRRLKGYNGNHDVIAFVCTFHCPIMLKLFPKQILSDMAPW